MKSSRGTCALGTDFKQILVIGEKSETDIMIEDEITEQIIGAAIEVHKQWGPGLYEEIYEKSMCVELRLRNISFEHQNESSADL